MSKRPTPLFDKTMRYCVRCCFPQTDEGIEFDEVGICRACRSSEEKMHIDWAERERALRKILDEVKADAKARGAAYDCMIPISGGKDSTFQLYMLTQVYGVRPLAVTFNHNWYSETGWYNLINSIETFNVDHFIYTPNRDLVNRMSKRSLEMIGDTCWHCHMGCGTFPLQIAVRFRIPLLVYGEHAAEGRNQGSYYEPVVYDREYFLKISARKTPEEMADCDYIERRELAPFDLPSAEECENAQVKGIHLGAYIFWDDERQTEFVRDNFGWKETEIEQTYKGYKSAECMMPGMHDFTCYLKRGFSRSTFHTSIDVRNGLMIRDEGLEMVKDFDPVRPEAMDYFTRISGLTEEEVVKAMEKHRKDPLRGMKLPVRPKLHKNRERILPFAQQLIEKHRSTGPHPLAIPDLAPVEPASHQAPADSVFLEMSAGQVIDGYRSGRFSPSEVAEACLARIERLDSKLHAFTCVDPAVLRRQARAAEERAAKGQPLRWLHGLPVGVKDVFNTRDFPTCMGSPLWEGFTPGNDARVVFNVLEAGAVVPGKTVTAEFAVHTLLAETLNPHDAARTPGTSSSGSATAVATGMAPFSLGTQTAGSIMRPASFCGVYGCKPSFGLIPRTGILKTTDTLDTVGFFAGWQEDLRRMFEVVRVKGANYPISNAALTDQARQNKAPGRPWRLALARTHTWEHAPDYAREALLAWAKAVAATGEVEVVEADLPASMAETHQVHGTIYDKTLSYYFQEEKKHHDEVSAVMNELMERGLSVSPEQYRKALERQADLAADMDEFLRDWDVMVSLSTAGEAPARHEVEKPDPCLMWTMTWLPVIGVPAFSGPTGLPFGLQLTARRFNDYLLFNFADTLAESGLIPRRMNPLAAVAR